MSQLSRPFLALAPMASITDAPYRLLLQKHFGADVLVSELISSFGIRYRDAKALKLCQKHPDERRVGAQIFGHDSETLCLAAQYVESLGYDFVDINLGCPVQRIVSEGAGAGMCRDVDQLCTTLAAIKASIGIPLTIKIRMGWDASSINAYAIIERAKILGIAWVAVHGRTRAQGYKGTSDWEYLRYLAYAFPNYVIGNGDIRSVRDYTLAVGEAPFLGVMIGRGALSYPWIFSEIRTGTPPELCATMLLDVLETYAAYLVTYRSDTGYVTLRLKKMAAWLSHGLMYAASFRCRLFAIANPHVQDILTCAREYFLGIASEHLSTRVIEPIYHGGEG